MEGTWIETDNEVDLKLTKLGGSDIAELHKVVAQDKRSTDNFDKPIVLELSSDGKGLNVTQTQSGPPMQPMVFKKQD